MRNRQSALQYAEINSGEMTAEQNPTANPQVTGMRPMGSINGTLQANPHIAGPYARDMDYSPIIYNLFGTRWGDVQLKNGLANGVASGRINSYRGEGWYDVIVPVVPGQTRQYGGGLPGNYPAKGPAPSQVQSAFDMNAGSQPSYPGGPGQAMGVYLINPGSGG
jgi:hypothetical protein